MLFGFFRILAKKNLKLKNFNKHFKVNSLEEVAREVVFWVFTWDSIDFLFVNTANICVLIYVSCKDLKDWSLETGIVETTGKLKPLLLQWQDTILWEMYTHLLLALEEYGLSQWIPLYVTLRKYMPRTKKHWKDTACVFNFYSKHPLS